MRYAAVADTSDQRWPDAWRFFLIALCTLIFCSCHHRTRQTGGPGDPFQPAAAALPAMAYTGTPTPAEQTEPWSPPGIRKPWPPEEYLRDGGDRGLPAEVGDQWEVRGLEMEDTIAHYDTLDGQTVVEPSNRVHIYSPRFGAVRKVVGLVATEQHDLVAGVHLPEKLVGPTTTQPVATSKQHVQADRRIGTKSSVAFRSRQGDGVLSNATKPRAFQDSFLPYENVKVIRQGIFEGTEMAWLARGVDAAITWSGDQAVQVILDRQSAMAIKSNQSLQSVFTIKEPPADPKLRVVKVASVKFAEPGDEVAFTIRFDNVGNQLIGNVTIIDNLTTRLEYVPDSAECTLDADFFTQPNEGGSLVIRCELRDPLPPGEGGILRFRCKVR